MPPEITTGSFDGELWPPELMEMALDTIIGGAPFASSITRVPTSRRDTVFPLVDPTGADWTGEGAPIPDVILDDRAYVVGVHKLAGIVELSNESVRDTAYDLESQLRAVLVDAFSNQMDTGLLTGTGAANNQPEGVIPAASEVTEASLWEAVTSAIGEIGDAGGNADTLALSPGVAAAEAGREDAEGRPVFPNGIPEYQQLQTRRVPGLTQALVYDSSRVFFIARDDFSVEQSQHAAWKTDGTSLRIKGRFAVAVPTPPKAIRKLTIGA